MKRIGIVGLAAIAALALLVLVGAASASAGTLLCKENVTSCPTGSIWGHNTSVQATLKAGTEFSISFKFGETCTGSAISGYTKPQKGSALPIEITNLTLSGCGKSCETAEAKNLPYTGNLEAPSGGNGTVTVAKESAGIYLQKCPLGVTCTFGLSGAQLTWEGGNPAMLAVKNLALTRTAGSEYFCGNKAEVNATYEITSPKPAYASTGTNPEPAHTALCKVLYLGEEECPEGSFYKSGSPLEAVKGEVIIDNGAMPQPLQTCTGATLTGKSKADRGNPALPLEFTSRTSGACTGPTCSWGAFEEENPSTTSLQALGEGNGRFTRPVQFKLTCGIYGTCTFSSKAVTYKVVAGQTEPRLKVEKAPLSLIAGNGNVCGYTQYMTATYTLSSPAPLYVTA